MPTTYSQPVANVVFNPLNQLLQGNDIVPLYKRNKLKGRWLKYNSNRGLMDTEALFFPLYHMLSLKSRALQCQVLKQIELKGRVQYFS